MVTDFEDSEQLSEWQVINDGVMGGVSSSEIVIGVQSVAVFQGYVLAGEQWRFCIHSLEASRTEFRRIRWYFRSS